MNKPVITVRRAQADDAAELCRLIRALADYEKMLDRCTASPESVAMMMKEPNGLGGIIAETDGRAVGMMVYNTYKLATFSGRRVFYIEDIFVEESMRGKGIGGLLFDKARETAEELECIKIEWKCLDWNSSAQGFYEKQGGIADDGWLTYTIDLRNG